ncbi:hypothetical protein [Micromonospora sp. DT31]|uniref:hypothetical protein n=1 Tax=Micromonospora sp. DT31 TaxID=3393434 RepID=UPI003CF333D3
MNEEQELRDRLEAVNVPPSRIEMDVVVRAGRQRAFRRRSVQASGGVALAAAMLLTVPSILTRAGAQPAVEAGAGPASASAGATALARPAGPCRMTELPVPSGMKDVHVTGVDPTGKYFVGRNVVGQDFQPILWTDGQPQALPEQGKSVEVAAVNASGVVVGTVWTPQEEYVFRYENGAYTRLHTPPGSWHPYPDPAINAAGDVIINVEPSGNTGGEDSIVLLWKAGSTTAITLPLPAEANAYDITDDGTIVGGIYKDRFVAEAYAWDQQGNGRKLELPTGHRGVAHAARGDWATGSMGPPWSVADRNNSKPPPTPDSALWNLKTGEVIKLGTRQGPGSAVNASGWVVAASGSVLRDGATVDLAVPNGQTSSAAAVSDTGLVVGQALTSRRYPNPKTRPGADGVGAAGAGLRAGLVAEIKGGKNLGPRMWRC